MAENTSLLLEQALQMDTNVKFEAPDGKSNLKFLDKLCRGGVIERFTKAKLSEAYAARLDQEMDFWATHENLLNQLLITWDCLYWARQHSIDIRDVHGTLNSTLTAYLLEITKLDPLKENTSFELRPDDQILEVKIIVSLHSDLLKMETFMASRYATGFRPVIEIAN